MDAIIKMATMSDTAMTHVAGKRMWRVSGSVSRRSGSAREKVCHVERKVHDPVLDRKVFLVEHKRGVVYFAFHCASSQKTRVLYHIFDFCRKSNMVEFKGFADQKVTRF